MADTLAATPLRVWTSNDYRLAATAMAKLLRTPDDALSITVTPIAKGPLHSTVEVAAMVEGNIRSLRKGATRADPLPILFPESAAGLFRMLIDKEGPGASVQYIMKKELVDNIRLLNQLKTQIDDPAKLKQYQSITNWINKNLTSQMRLVIIRSDGTEKAYGIGSASLPTLAQLQEKRRLATA